jgi:hypothetical protein
MTILSSRGLKRQKTKVLWSRYNEESQKTTFPQAKTASKYPYPQSSRPKEGKFIGPGFIWALLLIFWRFKE